MASTLSHSRQPNASLLAIPLALSLIKFLIHAVLNFDGGYGLFRDELYYIACAVKPAFGYVDHPPLSAIILKVNMLLFGDSIFSIRLIPALCAALTVWFTGLMAIRLGGGRWAVFFACLFTFSLGNFVMSSFYSMNSIEIFSWTLAAYLVVLIVQTEQRRYWIMLGVVLGLGLMNKIGVLFLGAGIFAGLIFTSERKWLFTPWPYVSGAIAFILFLPYILWNIQHDWAHLEFIKNASEQKYSGLSIISFLAGQLELNNPVAILIWLPGLVALFFSPFFRRWRILGFLYLVPLLILIFNKTSKDVYLLPAYSVLWAAGGVWLERLIQQHNWAKYFAGAVVVLWGVSTIVFIPLVLPVLPVEDYIAYSKKLGMEPSSAEGKELSELPQFYADMFGWEEKANSVAEVYNTLSEEDKANASIYSNNYGRCAAIDYYGKKLGLPPSIGSHNNYWVWGTGERRAEPLIILGGKAEDHAKVFESVTLMTTSECRYCMPYENKVPVYLCRGMKEGLDSVWPRVKHYE